MGAGIAWVAVVEGTIQPFAAHSGAIHALVQWLPRANTDALVTALTPTFSANEPTPSVVIDPTHATWVLVAYLVGFLVLAAMIFDRRDVT